MPPPLFAAEMSSMLKGAGSWTAVKMQHQDTLWLITWFSFHMIICTNFAMLERTCLLTSTQ
ncbi:predicted protein [Sclerotinia sclerotiorum 1980 UF-70]|uniref:Uncharacterized protein n=1 Tax=Sclerotinia sclerotiorum (strain ATCC 18683 / 1980 / Ss-1) TaxID=665079 RepID=A7F8S1_SCLS1|nr:predicted protein [Sclerotinia sclerotiorum 1980 UF-70]EDN99142.1 predicted protein [Sclerotinia sclerotiorum 1980 UF-70]